MNEYNAYCGLDCEACGGCPEMKTCEKVGAIIGNNPDARDRLENAGSV